MKKLLSKINAAAVRFVNSRYGAYVLAGIAILAILVGLYFLISLILGKVLTFALALLWLGPALAEGADV